MKKMGDKRKEVKSFCLKMVMVNATKVMVAGQSQLCDFVDM